MITRLAPALPVVIAALTLGVSSGIWPLAAIIGALAIAMALVSERWELDRGRQLVASVLGGMVGYAATALLFEQVRAHLTEGWTKLAAAALLAAAARFPQVRPLGGAAGSVALLYLGMLALGESRRAGAYPPLVVAFMLASLLSLRVDDRGRPPLTGGGLRPIAGAAALLALAAALGVGATLGLRAASAAAMRRATSTAGGWGAQKGFSDHIEIGALDGLLDSDTLVLRVRGPAVDYLRGAAFDTYESGRWLRSSTLEREGEETWADDLPEDADAVEIHALSDRTDRFFLPLDAGLLKLEPSPVLVDGLGAVKRLGKIGVPKARLLLGARGHAVPSPPTGHDLALGRRARRELTRLAGAWTEGATTPADKLDAIERRLASEYRYSLMIPRGNSFDPVLDFLLRDKQGHCELFASSLALLARAAGVPTRLVAGYRVAERSRFDDHRLVRERNAHAWVEAWIEGEGWTRRDPTPEMSVPQNQPHDSAYAAAVIDALRVRYDRLREWLGQRTLAQTAVVVALGFLVLGWVIARGARSNRVRRAPRAPDESPLPCLAALIEALARGGHAHDDTEPLERLAARLPDLRAAALLRRYAALRYGGSGDAESLAREMSEHAAQLRYGAASLQQRKP